MPPWRSLLSVPEAGGVHRGHEHSRSRQVCGSYGTSLTGVWLFSWGLQGIARRGGVRWQQPTSLALSSLCLLEARLRPGHLALSGSCPPRTHLLLTQF